MRNIILNLAVSLDGFIEGSNGEYDWCFTDQDYDMFEFINNIDSIFLGRKSYELLIKNEPDSFPNKKMYVFSDTFPISSSYELIRIRNAINKVREIKNNSGKNIWLFGGAELTSLFINNDLIDEMMLSVHPVLLGKGKHLFNNIIGRKSFKLTDTKSYSTGLIQLTYKRL